jgi:hypothetical protein
LSTANSNIATPSQAYGNSLVQIKKSGIAITFIILAAVSVFILTISPNPTQQTAVAGELLMD